MKRSSELLETHEWMPRVLVARFIRRNRRAAHLRADLEQEGWLAMAIAARKYRPEQGDFLPFAWRVIANAIRDTWVRDAAIGTHSGRHHWLKVYRVPVEDTDWRARPTPNPERQLEARDLASQLLRWASRNLPARDADMYARRLQGQTLESIGECHGVTKERARQVEARVESDFRAWLGVEDA